MLPSPPALPPPPPPLSVFQMPNARPHAFNAQTPLPYNRVGTCVVRRIQYYMQNAVSHAETHVHAEQCGVCVFLMLFHIHSTVLHADICTNVQWCPMQMLALTLPCCNAGAD